MADATHGSFVRKSYIGNTCGSIAEGAGRDRHISHNGGHGHQIWIIRKEIHFLEGPTRLGARLHHVAVTTATNGHW